MVARSHIHMPICRASRGNYHCIIHGPISCQSTELLAGRIPYLRFLEVAAHKHNPTQPTDSKGGEAGRNRHTHTNHKQRTPIPHPLPEKIKNGAGVPALRRRVVRSFIHARRVAPRCGVTATACETQTRLSPTDCDRSLLPFHREPSQLQLGR
eukprot:scaffold15117_cov121-Isochrysis_galbana.AAC.4